MIMDTAMDDESTEAEQPSDQWDTAPRLQYLDAMAAVSKRHQETLALPFMDGVECSFVVTGGVELMSLLDSFQNHRAVTYLKVQATSPLPVQYLFRLQGCLTHVTHMVLTNFILDRPLDTTAFNEACSLEMLDMQGCLGCLKLVGQPQQGHPLRDLRISASAALGGLDLMPGLRTLWIQQGSSVSKLPSRALAGLTKLNMLVLEGVSFPLDERSCLRSLTELILTNSNNFEQAGQGRAFIAALAAGLPSLQTLQISEVRSIMGYPDQLSYYNALDELIAVSMSSFGVVDDHMATLFMNQYAFSYL